VSRRAAIATIVAACVALSGCATILPAGMKAAPDIGIDDCVAGASHALLSVEALQCWFRSPHGRWRTLSHDSHLDVLVVQVEALDVRDASGIARAFVTNQRRAFSEILVYVRARPPDGSRSGASVRTRRVRWTRAGGFETFDFTAPPAL